MEKVNIRSGAEEIEARAVEDEQISSGGSWEIYPTSDMRQEKGV